MIFNIVFLIKIACFTHFNKTFRLTMRIIFELICSYSHKNKCFILLLNVNVNERYMIFHNSKHFANVLVLGFMNASMFASYTFSSRPAANGLVG